VILEPSTAGQPPLQTPTAPPTAAPLTLSVSERKSNISRVLKGVAASSLSADSMSLSSPPGTQSPKDFDKLSDGHVPKEVSSLSEHLQNLIMGRVSLAKTASRTRKIVIYICAADSQDCYVEKGALHNNVYPELRAHCRAKGYELHIVDLHWKTLLEKQQDHEFPELCIGELTRQMEVAYIIPVLFLNNSLGTPLLPITIESADFKMAMESVENQSAQTLLSKWYQLDSDAQPPCYRLQPISYHIPGFKETSPEERERAFEEWRTEIDKMLAVLITVFSQELRDTYLTTVVEQEVHNTVFMSQELAKRCIWINRVYTPTAKTPDNPSPGDAELYRRLNTLQKDLRNQLAEKHIVRIPVKYVEGGLNLEVPEHAQYIAQVTAHLRKHLSEMMDSIIDEHQGKTMLKPSHGIEAPLFEELNQQTSFCQKAAQCSINREKTINEIKTYINGDGRAPLVLFGPGGCGKTTLLARVAQCCQQWLPEAFLIFRFIGISAQSSTIEQLLSSITNQCSILTYGHKCYCIHNIETYERILPTLLAASCLQRPLIIILDGIDQVRGYSSKSIEWLPATLPENIKLVLSVSEGSDFYVQIAKRINQNTFIKMPLLGEAEAKGILMSSVMQYNHSVNSKIQDCVLKSVQECTLPLYSKVLAWQTSWWADKEHDIVPKGHVNDQLSLMLEELETILGVTQVQHALAIITSTKHGVTDSEMIDLLAFDDNFHSTTTYVDWAPACLTWSRLNKHLAPFLQWTLTGGVLGVQWRDNMLRQAVAARYKEHAKWANQMIYDYYTVSTSTRSIPLQSVASRANGGPASLPTFRLDWYHKRRYWENGMVVFACSFPNTIFTKHHTINCIPVICMYILSNKAFSSLLILVFYYQRSEVRDPPVQLPRLTVAVLLFSYNRRKLDELPFHYYQLKGEVENSPYIADITWIYDKVCGSNCYQILEDINLQWSVKNELTLLLRHFIETHASVLNYDGRQFYSHLYKYLEDKIRRKEISLESNDSTLAQVYSLTKNPPVLSFIPLNSVKEQSDESGAVFQESSFDLVVRLPETDQFVVSVSTNKEEICVWDVKQ
jgi:hypothetical protein